jgi:methylated-DNA-[protein]-cysteine S-methyltransferase
MIRTMHVLHEYQAIFTAPFGALGVCCEDEALTHIEFLPRETIPQNPVSSFAQTVCNQLAAYFADADFKFSLPLKLNGTDHQIKVWQAMCAIPRGETRQYGKLARELGSSPRAVGQACGANPVPIVIPCHRVVSKAGLGGFAHHRDGYELDIKRWLLAHEQR